MADSGVLTTFGDSITHGATVEPGQAWPDVLAAELGLGLSNQAQNSHQTIDQAQLVYKHETLPGSIAACMVGVDDNVRARADVDLAFYRRCLSACSAFLAIPRSALTLGTDTGPGGFTYGGGWQPTPAYSLGMSASDKRAWFELTVTGSVVYLAFIQYVDPAQTPPSELGACLLTVDGFPAGELITASGVLAPGCTNAYFGPALVRLELDPSRPHSIRGSLTRPGLVCLDWAWSNSADTTSYPELYLGMPTRLAPTRYPQFGTLAGTQRYAGVAMDVAGRLLADGLNVRLVDTYGLIEPSDLNDGVHPNAAGQVKLATAFLAAYNTAHPQTLDLRGKGLG